MGAEPRVGRRRGGTAVRATRERTVQTPSRAAQRDAHDRLLRPASMRTRATTRAADDAVTICALVKRLGSLERARAAAAVGSAAAGSVTVAARPRVVG